MRAALLLLALACAGCLRSSSFACAEDSQCTGSPGGTCQAVGFCSFADESCPGGQRYGDHSGPYAGQCVDGGGGGEDAGIDAPGDAFLGDCPATYAPLAGAGPHVYRAITIDASWAAQRTACTADGGYLVELGDAAEFAAVVPLLGTTEPWFGVTDQQTEGQYVTGRGAPATFLPWDDGEPNNSPTPGDCIRGKPNATYGDDRCATLRPAVCECEP